MPAQTEARRPVNNELIGFALEPQSLEHGPGLAISFALANGLSRERLDDTRYLIEEGRGWRHPQHVLPWFPILAGYKGGPALYQQIALSPTMVHLHERLVFSGTPVPSKGEIRTRKSITAVARYERGTAGEKGHRLGALVTIGVDCGSEAAHFCNAYTTLYNRGEEFANFAGAEPAPEYEQQHVIEKGRVPDYYAQLYVLPILADLFARAGDGFNGDTNPMHRVYGYGLSRPFVQGRMTLGMVLREAIRARGRNLPTSLRSYEGIFAGKVYDGDTLNVSFYDEGPNSMLVHVTRNAPGTPTGLEDVITNARIELH